VPLLLEVRQHEFLCGVGQLGGLLELLVEVEELAHEGLAFVVVGLHFHGVDGGDLFVQRLDLAFQFLLQHADVECLALYQVDVRVVVFLQTRYLLLQSQIGFVQLIFHPTHTTAVQLNAVLSN